MDMKVEWYVIKKVNAVVSVPDDSNPGERHAIAAKTVYDMTPEGHAPVRGTANWSTVDGEFGGVLT